jgi:hypothetical protein
MNHCLKYSAVTTQSAGRTQESCQGLRQGQIFFCSTEYQGWIRRPTRRHIHGYLGNEVAGT